MATIQAPFVVEEYFSIEVFLFTHLVERKFYPKIRPRRAGHLNNCYFASRCFPQYMTDPLFLKGTLCQAFCQIPLYFPLALMMYCLRFPVAKIMFLAFLSRP